MSDPKQGDVIFNEYVKDGVRRAVFTEVLENSVVEGVKLDAGKPRADLLPADALLEVAAVLDYGAKKYAARNWEKGMAWGRLSGALLRHLFAWMGGEERDPESGLRHLAHAACCALMLQALTLRAVGTKALSNDDRGVSP